MTKKDDNKLRRYNLQRQIWYCKENYTEPEYREIVEALQARLDRLPDTLGIAEECVL